VGTVPEGAGQGLVLPVDLPFLKVDGLAGAHDPLGQPVDGEFVLVLEVAELGQSVEPLRRVVLPEVRVLELEVLGHLWKLGEFHRNP